VETTNKKTAYCWVKVSLDTSIYKPGEKNWEPIRGTLARPPVSTRIIGAIFPQKSANAGPGLDIDEGYSGVMGSGLALAYAVFSDDRQAAIDWLADTDGREWIQGALTYELVAVTL